MNIIEIPIQKGQTLADALKNKGYKTIPSNVVFDKTLTGIGATYMEIHAKRHSIIIEPNVPVIESKVEQHPDCFAVKKGVKEASIKKYLNDDSIVYKKLLTTPESFSKIRDAAIEVGLDFYNTFFCMFDECEKIGQDINYRDSIAFPINDFFKFKEKAFVSATPLQMVHDVFDNQEFSRIVVTPQYNYKEDLALIVTEAVRKEFKAHVDDLLTNNSQCICIFFNSTAGIKTLIELFQIPADRYAVFCSDKSKTELKQKGIEAVCNFNPLHIRKLNFFTSRFYSAVDFNLTVCPDVIVITEIDEGSYTMVDPQSEVIQIQGRFRNTHKNNKRYNSFTHITNLSSRGFMPYNEVLVELKTWYEIAKTLKQSYLNSSSAIEKNAIAKEFKKCNIYKYLDTHNIEDDFKRNTFALINRYNGERVTEYYSDGEKLHQAYLNSNYFNVSFIDKIDHSLKFNFDFSPKDLVAKINNKRTTQKEKINAILDQYNKGIARDKILAPFNSADASEMYSNVSNIIDAVNIWGIDAVRNETAFKAIEKKLDAAKLFNRSEQQRFSPQLITSLHNLFANRLKTQIPQTEIKQELQKIYNEFGIISKNGKQFKVTQSTIEDYYDCKVNNATRTYTLISLLPYLADKIQAESCLCENG